MLGLKGQVSPRKRLSWDFAVERVTGIEPASRAWEALILPLNYTRDGVSLTRALLVTVAEPLCGWVSRPH